MLLYCLYGVKKTTHYHHSKNARGVEDLVERMNISLCCKHFYEKNPIIVLDFPAYFLERGKDPEDATIVSICYTAIISKCFCFNHCYTIVKMTPSTKGGIKGRSDAVQYLYTNNSQEKDINKAEQDLKDTKREEQMRTKNISPPNERCLILVLQQTFPSKAY